MSTLFWTACIPTRTALAVTPVLLPEPWLQPFGVVLLGIGIAFSILYTFNLRQHAMESSTSTTWWHEWRIVHALLYMTAGILCIQGNRNAWIPLVIDICIALIAYHVSYQA